MSATNAFETDLLSLILHNLNAASIGDAGGLRGSVVAGNLFVSLHTADPGEAGAQNTTEATYTGYARVAVVRSSAGFTLGAGTWSNAAAVNFPAATGGSNVLTHFGIGTDATLAGKLLLKGAFGTPASLTVSAGIAPAFAIGALTGTVD